MKYLLLLLLSYSVNAVTIEQAVETTNKKVNPNKFLEGSEGYEVDHREDDGSVWVNINKVQYLCRSESRSYVLKGVIETKQIKNCDNFWMIGKGGATNLYQIHCEKLKGTACKKRLAEELSADTVKTMIKNNIHDLYIK